MKSFFYSLTITIFIFFTIDFVFGNKILKVLYGKGLIMSEEKKITEIKDRRNEERKYRIKNKIYHHTLKPNIKAKSVWGKNKYDTCTDENGFRQHCGIKNDYDKNLIIIGDSFVEGIGLEYEKTFAGMISKELNYSVYNMGVSSYSPVIYKNKIIYFIEKGLKIKNVLVFVDISDIDDEANNYIECEKKVCGKKVLDNKPERKVEKIKKKFPLYDLLKSSIKNIKRTIKPKIYIYRRDFVRSNWTFVDETKNIKLGIKNSVKHMSELYSYLNEKNISLSVAIYPHPGQIIFDQEDSKQVKIWENFCANKCRYFINYFPIFFNKLDSNKPKKIIDKYYIKNDIHFNHKGNIIIYEKLKDYIFD